MHINMDLKAHASKKLTEKGQVDSSMKNWKVVPYSSTTRDYIDNLSRFMDHDADDQTYPFTHTSI